jgi:hypothetical protein
MTLIESYLAEKKKNMKQVTIPEIDALVFALKYFTAEQEREIEERKLLRAKQMQILNRS